MFKVLQFRRVTSTRKQLEKLIVPTSCGLCGRSMSLYKGEVTFDAFPPNVVSRTHYYLPRFAYATSTKVVKEAAAVESLTHDERVKVLKVVNDVQCAEDLLKYFIPKKRAEEVIKRKNENQAISTLEQLISIVGPKNSSKFFCSILNKPIPVTMNAAMYPVLTTEQISSISKVLSIIIVGDRISWCLIERLGKGEHVQLSVESFHQINYSFKPRMHFLALLKEMEAVISQLPESELYIVEEYPANVPTPYMFNFQLQMAQAKSTILGLITSRSKGTTIMAIKTVTVARMFNTFIGSEKVSGQYIVEDMLMGEGLPYIKVPDQIIQSYKTVDAKMKESLSQAFLLNLAYWKLTKQTT